MNTKHLSLAIALLFSTTAYAGEAAKQIESSIGAKITRTGPSAMPGYTAILAEKDGKKRIFYETNDGQHMFYGMFYDAKGVNLTTLDIAKLAGNSPVATAAPKSPGLDEDEFIVSQNLLNMASKTFYIKEGKGNVVYVVFDPDCPYCKELYRKTRNSLANAEIRWIPVGALSLPGGPSQRKTAELMRIKKMDGVQSLQGVTPTPAEEKLMQTNLEMLAALEANQVPLVLWQDKKEVHLIKGLPKENRIPLIFGKRG